MTAGLANVLAAPSVAVVPRIEPYLVEVVVPFPLGSADQAVAAAAEKVAELLAQPSLGEALAATPDATDDGPRVATTAMVQAVARAVTEAAREMVGAALLDLLTKPGRLSAMLPSEPPPDSGVPWLNKGGLVVSGMNPTDD